MSFKNFGKFASMLGSTLLLFASFTVSASAQGSTHQPTWNAHPPIHIKNGATSTYQNGYAPAQVKKGYGIDQLTASGAGQTIAIVDAYGSPTISSDIATFDQQFGLPAANLQIVYPSGQPKRTDGGWALETAMDVEWAHAIAPSATIMLVVAKSSSIADLIAGIDYATNHGAQVVSNSWGGSEFSSENTYDSHFQHTGVVYLASSGDNGSGVSFPASSPYVVSVGGTTFNIDSAANYVSESAWSGSGGGLSTYELIPTYQSNWINVVGTQRGNPDISFDADPNTGVAVISSTKLQGQSGWFQVGGTSLGSPAWAALVALADEGRTAPLSSTDALTKIYSIAGTTGSAGYTTNYHDITSGNNGGFNALAGYDLVTGIGSPIVNQLIPLLSQ